MEKTDCPFHYFIDNYDLVGWVPTIRGSLSLSVFDDTTCLWGDVDKYAIEFKTTNNNKTSRYLAASSLITFDDRKRGKWSYKKKWEYKRTFRIFFRGSINDEAHQAKFDEDLHGSIKPDLTPFFKEKEVLIGKLSIVTIRSNIIKKPYYRLLKIFNQLTIEKRKYIKHLVMDDFYELEIQKQILKSYWDNIENSLTHMETTQEGNNPIYTFNVVLSRDGILFLKDVTPPKFRNYYKKNTVIDHAKNLHVHRISRIAMYYIKFLFHANYYHNEENDAFLPPTNLHQINSDENLVRVVNHQLDALLSPLIKVKRNANNSICEPKGLLLYAKSFVYIHKNNKFISYKDANLLCKFINQQSDDFDVLQSDKKIIRNSFLSQNNFLARFAIGLAFLLAVINAIRFVNEQILSGLILYKILIVVGSLLCGMLIHSIVATRAIAKGRFIKKERYKSILNRNSKIIDKKEEGKISNCYAFRMYGINIKRYIGELNILIINAISKILIIIGVILVFSPFSNPSWLWIAVRRIAQCFAR